ncbi:phosphate ABC transporter permease subunit PstC [Treponema porcinum]|uniref:phosphate ABC transporter permease subunit PstC n=1 Tax=Treponema porcinum TaxID=261392 RepID=UPI003F0C805A
MKTKLEFSMKMIFFLTACVSVAAVALICFFMFANGIPAMHKIGFTEFIFGLKWKPELELFGIFPMIVGSIIVTAGAIVIGVPVGIMTAIFMARFCPAQFYPVMKHGVNLLAGIPSVVYGFFGLTAIVPVIRAVFGGSGTSILAASIVLAIMILPTIVSVSETSLRAVPSLYFEGSLALGACKERSVFFAELPAAKSGIVAGVILGVGRAVGETMAVIMVAGNQAVLPHGLTKGIRTLTANIVLEMGYAAGLHREALIATAVVLFFFILVINFIFMMTKHSAE